MEFEPRANTAALRAVGGDGNAPAADSKARARPRVLCVDDESDALTILRLFLSAHGFEITVAVNAADALRLIAERRPDLIITDYAMPDMNGLELCRTLRERDDTRDIPVILHTGIELSDERSNLFDRFILKPADLDLLEKEIRSLLPADRA